MNDSRICVLCSEQLSDVYYKNNVVKVFKCPKCKQPICILNKHTIKLNDNDRTELISSLVWTMNKKLKKTKYMIDANFQEFPDHAHIHARY